MWKEAAIMSWASRILVWLAAVWLSFVAAEASAEEPGAREEGRTSSAAISPNGKWLVIQVTETGELPEGLPVEYLGAFLNTGRRLYRVALSAKSPKVATIHETKAANRKTLVLQKMQSIQSPLVLDDGTTIALKDRVLLARWGLTGKLSEKKVFEESRPLLKFHLAAGGKKLLLDQDVLGRGAAAVEVLDLRTHEITRPPWIKGLQGSTIRWAADLKQAYGVELLPKAAPAEKTASRPPTTGRLVRISVESGERVTVAPNVSAAGVFHGKDSIVWFLPGAAGGSGSMWRARKSVDGTLEELTSLKGWEPVVSLDEDRFLLRGTDRRRHGIVDLAAPAAPATGTAAPPVVKPIALPSHVRLFYSPALKGFVLAKDPLTWAFVDLNGKEGWTFRLEA
jgi:hypothetical protein